MIQESKFVLKKVENIVGIGENAGHQHFLLLPQCFARVSSFMVVKSWDCVARRYTVENTACWLTIFSPFLTTFSRVSLPIEFITLALYSPTNLKNNLCLFLQDLQVGM